MTNPSQTQHRKKTHAAPQTDDNLSLDFGGNTLYVTDDTITLNFGKAIEDVPDLCAAIRQAHAHLHSSQARTRFEKLEKSLAEEITHHRKLIADHYTLGKPMPEMFLAEERGLPKAELKTFIDQAASIAANEPSSGLPPKIARAKHPHASRDGAKTLAAKF